MDKTLDDLKLQVSLRDAIQGWYDRQGEAVDVWCSEHMIDLMARQAWSVIETVRDYDTSAETQKWYA